MFAVISYNVCNVCSVCTSAVIHKSFACKILTSIDMYGTNAGKTMALCIEEW